MQKLSISCSLVKNPQLPRKSESPDELIPTKMAQTIYSRDLPEWHYHVSVNLFGKWSIMNPTSS